MTLKERLDAEYKEEKAKLDKAHKEAIEELDMNWEDRWETELATQYDRDMASIP